jgi:nicotinamidase-related amidase
MKALLIVDMQDHFFDSEPIELNEKICEVIAEYRRLRWPIVVLEYRTNPYDPDDQWCGRTNDTIREELTGYRNLAIFGKDEDDGSRYIKAYILNHMDGVEELELVGVNLDCCVMSTAKGLADDHYDKQITILEECCDSNSSDVANRGYDEVLADTQERVNNSSPDNLQMLINQRG